MEAPARELFIYYRVAPASVRAARLAVEQLQRTLTGRHPGLQARLLRRPLDADSTQTWMETYAMATDTGGGIDDAIEADIASHAAALAALLHSPRRIEVFVDDRST